MGCDVLTNFPLWHFDDGLPAVRHTGKAFCFGAVPPSWHALNNMAPTAFDWRSETVGVKSSSEAAFICTLGVHPSPTNNQEKLVVPHGLSALQRCAAAGSIFFLNVLTISREMTECGTYLGWHSSLKTTVNVAKDNSEQTYINCLFPTPTFNYMPFEECDAVFIVSL